ncbi:MAG: hypothetical protein RIR11_4365 [Bacteroidota bacterium]|jgi:hypothetical protein
MIKNLTLLLAFVCTTLSPVNAQQTGDEIFVIDIKIDGVTTTYKNGTGGFSAPADWGGPILGDICAEAVWGYDSSVPSDSLCCDTILNNYSGKAVLVRRGACNYDIKMYNAQQSGASIAIVANGYAAAHGDANNAPSMGATNPFVQIPVMLFCRNMVDVIDAGIKAGKKPNICIRRSNLHDPTGGYAYATPIAQADTVDLISVGCINRTGIGQNFTGKVTITDPVGVVTTLESTQYIEAGADSVILFDSYVPISPKIGTYKMEFTTDLTTNTGDTVTRQFIYTPNTYATDNFTIKGGTPVDLGIGAMLKHSVLSLYRTGDAGLTVKYVTFGIYNAATVAVADPAANVVNLLLYDADTNDDGITDEGTGVGAFDDLPFVAFVDYEFDAGHKSDSLVTAVLLPIDASDITLKPNHFYYLRAIYDGTSANVGTPLSFTCTNQVNYTPRNLGWAGIGHITPVILDNLYAGWAGLTAILRLHDKAFGNIIIDNTTTLALSKYAVSPNPAVEYTAVNLELAALNKSVTVSIIDMQGRIVASQIMRDFQSGQIRVDTRNLASGHYALSIRSSEEGAAMTNLMICH